MGGPKKRALRKDVTPELRDPWRMTADDWALIEQWAAEGRRRIAPEPGMAELQERARARQARKAERDSAKRRAAAEAERLRRFQASTRGKAAARGATYLEMIAAAMRPGAWYSTADLRAALPDLSYGGIKLILARKGRALGMIERAKNPDCGFKGGEPFGTAVRMGRAGHRFLYRLTAKGEALAAAYRARRGEGPK